MNNYHSAPPHYMFREYQTTWFNHYVCNRLHLNIQLYFKLEGTKLRFGLHNQKGGRNNQGKKTVRGIGSKSNKRYYYVNYSYNGLAEENILKYKYSYNICKKEKKGRNNLLLINFEYNNFFHENLFNYILDYAGSYEGYRLIKKDTPKEMYPGYTNKVSYFPQGTKISQLSYLYRGATIARSPGASIKILSKYSTKLLALNNKDYKD